MIFRIDDVSVNTDPVHLVEMVQTLHRVFPRAKIMLAVSPIVFNAENADDPLEKQRIFPRILKAHSNHRSFFRMDRMGIPDLPTGSHIVVASHGLVHVDHRLMSCEAQELSIFVSCSLLRTYTFVPPFNMYNEDTKRICDDEGIELIRFEEGWRNIHYQRLSPNTVRYYMHTHDTKIPFLRDWLKGEA